MKLAFSLLAALAVTAVLPQVAAADNDALPADAISSDVIAVVILRADGMQPEAMEATHEAIVGALPPALAKHAEDRHAKRQKQAKEYLEGYKAIVEEAGVEVAVLGLLEPKAEGDKPKAFMLARANADSGPERVEKTLQRLDKDGKNPKAEAWGGGWVAVTSDDLVAPPKGRDDQAAAAFARALNVDADHGMVAAIRITPGVRDYFEKKLEEPKARRNPGTALMRPLLDLDTATLAVRFGDQPRVHAALTFRDERSADMFRGNYTAMINLGRGASKGYAANLPEGKRPGPAAIDAAFDALLDGEGEGKTLALTLGLDFVKQFAAAAAPFAEAMAERHGKHDKGHGDGEHH